MVIPSETVGAKFAAVLCMHREKQSPDQPTLTSDPELMGQRAS